MTYRKDNPESIQEMFDSIAKHYDSVNAINSLQMYRLWNRKLIGLTTINNPKNLLDLCSGTGEIAFSYLKRSKEPKNVYMIDFCNEMLKRARIKGANPCFKEHQISFIQADAQNIPLEDECMDCVTLAYGIRNVKNPLNCLNEVFRVLKPGGTFGILELTEPKNLFLKFFHKIYLKTVLPLVGRLFTSNKQAYEYLCNSIHTFIKPHDLECMLKEAGFSKTFRKKLSGGIATIFIAKKG